MITPCALVLLVSSCFHTAAAGWIMAGNDRQRLCEDLRLCTGSEFAWSMPTTYNQQEACAELARKGLRDLHFFGASLLSSSASGHWTTS